MPLIPFLSKLFYFLGAKFSKLVFTLGSLEFESRLVIRDIIRVVRKFCFPYFLVFSFDIVKAILNKPLVSRLFIYLFISLSHLNLFLVGVVTLVLHVTFDPD